jgi:pyruvate/2-oxoglutarate dehydrogenase complex dihydrolipoamide acyltransferase (E2) component
MCYVALTFDHRLVDGADADRFMAHVKTALSDFDEAGM